MRKDVDTITDVDIANFNSRLLGNDNFNSLLDGFNVIDEKFQQFRQLFISVPCNDWDKTMMGIRATQIAALAIKFVNKIHIER